jgi:hypothetical protein
MKCQSFFWKLQLSKKNTFFVIELSLNLFIYHNKIDKLIGIEIKIKESWAIDGSKIVIWWFVWIHYLVSWLNIIFLEISWSWSGYKFSEWVSFKWESISANKWSSLEREFFKWKPFRHELVSYFYWWYFWYCYR